MKITVTETPAIETPAQEESWMDWVPGWNRFWFRPIDPTLLCVMRIFCGIATLYVHLSYSFGLFGLVGSEGWADKQAVKYWTTEAPFVSYPFTWDGVPQVAPPGWPSWSVWFHVEDPFWIVFLHVAFLLAMFFYTIGFCTKITGTITWIATLSYINRIPNMVFGMDAMMVIVQTYLLIGPSGAMYSLDRWLQRRRIGWWRNDAEDPDHPTKSVLANLALRMMQIHFCFVYGVTGLAKLNGHNWWTGDAVFQTIANPNFAPMQSPLYMGLMFFITKHRWLYHVVFSGLSWGTLVLEIGFSGLVWNRKTRWVMITASVLLHTGIGFVMGLVGFSMFMLVFVASFVPPETAVLFMRHAQARLQGPMRKIKARMQAVLKKGASPPMGKPKEEVLALHP